MCASRLALFFVLFCIGDVLFDSLLVRLYVFVYGGESASVCLFLCLLV